ncbi:MAG: nucleotidyltransferase domain-containing protein [Candidatus Methanoperedens sp.]|nr:nucleotidyltransferase domain-containing protein [Candidatus Methanoperedens sp.]
MSGMKTMNAETERKTDEIMKILRSFDFIHSILLFGSRARGKTGRDIDICIIPSRELSLRERLSIDSAVPSGVDISIYFDLPIHIRKRISEEGKVLYTKDMYHLLTLFKKTDSEYSGYRRYREYYNEAIRERMKKRIGRRAG